MVDDTIFITSEKVENARAMRYILRNFELLSGLKVNFNKCSLMGVNVERERLDEMAGILRCEVGLNSFFVPWSQSWGEL